MKKTFLIYSQILYVLFICISCSHITEDPEDLWNRWNDIKSLPLTRNERLIPEAQKNFCWDVFEQLIETSSRGRDVMYSPYTLQMALSLLANGVDEDARNQILDLLGFNAKLENPDTTFSNLDYNGFLDWLNSYNRCLFFNLGSLEPTFGILDFANSLWLNGQAHANPEFENTLATYGTQLLYSSSSQLPDDLNKWCDRLGPDRFRGLYDNASEGSSILFASIAKFDFLWNYWYKFTRIVQGNFHNYDGTDSYTNFMELYGAHFEYYDFDSFYMFEMKLGNSGYIELTLILPKDGVSLDDCIHEYRSLGFAILEKKKPGPVMLRIPKVSMSAEDDFVPILQKLGITNIFTPGGADFSAIASPASSVTHLSQKMSITFGLDAVVSDSATSANLGTIGSRSDEPSLESCKELYFDRPFIFMINLSTKRDISLLIGMKEMI